MSILDSGYISDAVDSALHGLGVDNGGSAVKTVENLFKSPASPAAPAPNTAITAATSAVTMPSLQGKIFGIDKKTALMIGGVALAAIILIHLTRK